jgi:uncharacterized protein YcbX
MGGERLQSVAGGSLGLAGDRGWAIVDAETGKVASAKNPKLWLSLLECSAAYESEPPADGPKPPVRVTLPGGRAVSSDDPDCDRQLSEGIGRQVTLASTPPPDAAYELSEQDAHGLTAENPDALTETGVGLVSPPGTFFDTSTLHVLTSQTLAHLASFHPDGEWDIRRFRPNVVIDLEDDTAAGFAENEWVGSTLTLGALQALVLAPMPRCVMTTLPQGDLPRDPLILRTLAERNRVDLEGHGSYACVGALTNVTQPGEIAVGDQSRIRAGSVSL